MITVDIHTHLLPGVDDGPATLAETVEALRHCHEDGTRVAVMTPHMFSPFCGSDSVDAMRRVFDQTLGELRRLQMVRPECEFLTDMELLLGAENYLSAEFLNALARRDVLPLGNGSHVLLEFGPYTEFEAMLAATKKILDAGYVPVLAHVERYTPVVRRFSRFSELVAEGCVAQVNAGGVLESHHRSGRPAAVSLLEQGIASVVASDVHDTGRRGSWLTRARTLLSENFSSDQVEEWMSIKPRSLLEAA